MLINNSIVKLNVKYKFYFYTKSPSIYLFNHYILKCMIVLLEYTVSTIGIKVDRVN